MARQEDLLDRCILIVEDDYLLAFDVEGVLSQAGAQVTGPFAREPEALAAVTGGGLHAAVIDINLGQGPSFHIADALHAAAIPFVFLTGYDQSIIPSRFQHVARLAKPVNTQRILQELVSLLGSVPARN